MLIADRRALIPFVLSASALAGACQSRPAAPPSPASVSPDVWAVVNGHEIRQDEVDKAYRRAMQPGQAVSDEEATTAKLNLLDQVIVQDLMLARANELKIVLPDSELDAAFNEQKKNIPDEEFNKELAARNLTAADMREAMRRDMLAQKVIDQDVTAKVNVTDEDIKAFFEANKAQFNLPEDAYHLAQIVVTPAKSPGVNNRTGDDAATPQEAAAKVQMIMGRLKAGTPFNELAADFSEEPDSAPQGGDLGLVPVSAMRQAPAALRDAVQKATPGTVRAVSVPGAYVIVALVAKQPAGQRDPSMPEVRNDISALLKGRLEQLLRTAYLEAVRNRATIVNHAARRIVDSIGTNASAAPAAAKP